jgi:hypothetical protein
MVSIQENFASLHRPGRLQDGISLFSDFVAIVCGRLQDGISLFSDFVGNFSDTSTLSLFDLDSVEKKSK